MKKRYLVKIEFDCNDGDYVTGLQVITDKEKEIIERNFDKEISFGSCDFGENTCAVIDCVTIEEITEEQYLVLKNLDLLEFGEGNSMWYKYLDTAEEWKDPDEDDDDNDED